MGLLGKAEGGGCSAVLIEPDLVLTAGHCANIPPEAARDRVFRPSTDSEMPGAGYRGAWVTLHPTWVRFATLNTDILAVIARDIALFRLERPVEPGIAVPIPAQHFPADATGVTMVSFRGGGLTPLKVRDCPLFSLRYGVFTVDCEVRSGESGAPILARTEAGLAVVGIVSRTSRRGGTGIALGAALGETYDVLRAAEIPLNAE